MNCNVDNGIRCIFVLPSGLDNMIFETVAKRMYKPRRCAADGKLTKCGPTVTDDNVYRCIYNSGLIKQTQHCTKHV